MALPERKSRQERGSVTAETALLIPSLVLLLLLAVGVIAAGRSVLALGEGTRIYARELARGTDPAEAESMAQRQSPGASFSVAQEGSMTTVRGERVLAGWLPVTLHAEASIPREEGTGPDESTDIEGNAGAPERIAEEGSPEEDHGH